MPLDFVAIDFETANFSRASACSIGVARVVEGKLQSCSQWFITPPGGPYFTNTIIHGITEEHVSGAPTWQDTLDRLEEFATGLPLVAYSGFDRGVYKAANALTGSSDRGFQWLNAHSLAKRMLPASEYELEDYRLPTIASHLGIPAFDHHQAAEDAVACANIVLRLAARNSDSDIETLWPKRPSVPRDRAYTPRAPLPEPRKDADPDHPLFGQSICFTGKLDSYTKSEAEIVAANFGATVERGVTKRTTLVVIGQFSIDHLREGATISSKAERAMSLKAKGQQIEVRDEDGFLALLNLEPDDY